MAIRQKTTGNEAALRKRSQIQLAGKTMFIWVAAASLIIGGSGVGVYLLAQRIHFGNQVISEKWRTKSTLDRNLDTADELLEEVQVLNTDSDLRKATLSDDQNPVEVVIDALPADANSSALAASLQKRILAGDGVSIESLSVDSVADEADTGEVEFGEESKGEGLQEIPFTFDVSAKDPATLKKMLERAERSIRTVTFTRLELESQGKRLRLTGEGVGYYQPKVTTIMKEVTVPKR